MPALSILQVAVSGRAVRERIAGRTEALAATPARVAREVGLALQRARTSLTHGVVAHEATAAGPGADARLEQVIALEAGRKAPEVHADDGVTVVTLVTLGAAPLWASAAPGDARAVEGALHALAAMPDSAVTRVAVHLAPAVGAFDPASVVEGYPHLAPLSLGGETQVRCRYCGMPFEAHRTSCPSCGGAVER